MEFSAKGLHFSDVNAKLRLCEDKTITIRDVEGQRYLASGMRGKDIRIHGTPGNALGAYLDKSSLHVYGNAQDAAGDTMNDGDIIVHGNCGDAAGYAMRGGTMLVRGSAGYRVGIHMKEYCGQKPVIMIGKCAGDFLGEYQAGGLIIALGLECDGPCVGNYCGTGMHGGKIFIRGDKLPSYLPVQVNVSLADNAAMGEIIPYISEFCRQFQLDKEMVLAEKFYCLTPNTKNPYKQLYTYN